eukprot:CAMPEP_0168618062 /NCGR_PEP_ID=MMETSP0449_2-20121227/5872_1 /TAXON_ID=1082188 /ORGANISM="Strombidium rassoulzadegani, Strain ras09" /LENGTH=81 /DNA_ID=CAMNT_0008658913 /DNA_START=1129 /DNA_END=1370 /DNA_ORIENTATION=+
MALPLGLWGEESGRASMAEVSILEPTLDLTILEVVQVEHLALGLGEGALRLAGLGILLSVLEAGEAPDQLLVPLGRIRALD